MPPMSATPLPVSLPPTGQAPAALRRWVGTGDFNEQVPQAAVVPQGIIAVQPLVPIAPAPAAARPARRAP